MYGDLNEADTPDLADALREKFPELADFFSSIPPGFHPYVSFKMSDPLDG